MVIEKSLVGEEPEVPTNSEIPKVKVTLEKGYYQGVYTTIYFKKKVVVDMKEYQADVEDDTDEEEMEDLKFGDERECHWRIVFDDNDGELDNKRTLLYAKRWDVSVNENENIIKGGNLVEVVASERKKVLW